MTSSPESAPLQAVALTGFMSAGKSTAGKALAWLLRWRFIDLDCEIECHEACSVREIFARQGEAEFRAKESLALRRVLESAAIPTVIALGGGTFIQPANAELLRRRGVSVVFLELPLNELLERCRATGERLGENPRPLAEDEAAFCALYEARLPLYRRADLVVNAENKTPEQIASEIAQALRLPIPAAQDS
jgi:shikimate kinase